MTDLAIAGPSVGPDNDLCSPEFNEQLLAGIEVGIDVEDYLCGRASGVSHDELVDVFAVGIPVKSYLRCRLVGADHHEVMAAPVYGIEVPIYADGLQNGISHSDMVKATKAGINLPTYIRARSNGATHAQIRRAADSLGGVGLSYYNHALEAGATHDEVLDAHHKGISPMYYSSCREVGQISHREVISAHGCNILLSDYARERRYGLSHNKAMDRILGALGETRTSQWTSDYSPSR